MWKKLTVKSGNDELKSHFRLEFLRWMCIGPLCSFTAGKTDSCEDLNMWMHIYLDMIWCFLFSHCVQQGKVIHLTLGVSSCPPPCETAMSGEQQRKRKQDREPTPLLISISLRMASQLAWMIKLCVCVCAWGMILFTVRKCDSDVTTLCCCHAAVQHSVCCQTCIAGENKRSFFEVLL